MKNNGDYFKHYVSNAFLDKYTSLYENRMLSCVRCKELTPVSCENCAYTNFNFGAAEDGIYCAQCEAGFTRWTCQSCQTQNPVNENTVYLKKKKGCFIATAAYGSLCAPELIDFYRFRDEVLSKSNSGSRIVELYYIVAPPIASLVSKSEALKSATRVFMLAPILRVVRFTLRKGRK
jgi:hypothetical protein